MQKIAIIVAIGKNNEIGKNNKLLWHVPEDLKRFKRLTSGCCVVMGRNTYHSLPVRPLPKRRNIVISDDHEDHFEGCEMAYSIEESIQLMDKEKENFIIGGGMIYQQFMNLADRLYITRINKHFDADTFFPVIKEEEWDEISREDHQQEIPEKLSFSYIIFEKKKM